MSRILKALLLLNLVLLTVLVFAFPNLMVGPGKLVPGHKALETDCFACHSAFTGVSPAKCASCHKAADIGRRTTKGTPIVKPRTATPFHQQLSQAGQHVRFTGTRRALYQVQQIGGVTRCYSFHLAFI